MLSLFTRLYLDDADENNMRKKIKRKLIGFIAGEKGNIGKLQGLALGIGGLIAGGLIPNITQAWHHPWSGDAWSGDAWSGDVWAGDNWSGNDWSGDWSGDHWSDGGWKGDAWTGDVWAGDIWSGNDWTGDVWAGNAVWVVNVGDGWSGDVWSGDWSGDWPANAPPKVEKVEGEYISYETT